jgi:hypothetical protein
MPTYVATIEFSDYRELRFEAKDEDEALELANAVLEDPDLSAEEAATLDPEERKRREYLAAIWDAGETPGGAVEGVTVELAATTEAA